MAKQLLKEVSTYVVYGRFCVAGRLRQSRQLFVRILTAQATLKATLCMRRALSNKMNNDRADGHC